ncbi:MAG: hypothetical protein ACI4G1_07180 [Ruminococcus sp.]
MKKVVSLILCTVMLTFALYGCESKVTVDSDSQTSDSVKEVSSAVSSSASSDDIDWSKVLCTKAGADDSESSYYVIWKDAIRGYDSNLGVMSNVLEDAPVVLTVASGDKLFAEDYNLDLDSIKSTEDILPGMEYVFCQNIEFEMPATPTNILVLSDEKKPYITIESTSNEKVKAQSKEYDVCKSVGTCHYMTRDLGTADSEYEASIGFVAYSTFLSDGMPFYCAALDVSEDQSAKKACEDNALLLMQGLNEVSADFFG